MPDKPTFPLVIGNAIFAEDIRSESNGKFSILGVYSGDILVQEMTGFLRGAVYLELTSRKLGRMGVKVDAYLDKDLIFSADGLLDVKNNHDPAVFHVPTFPIALVGPGDISIYVTCEGVRRRALVKSVKKADLKAVARAREASEKSLARPARTSRRARSS